MNDMTQPKVYKFNEKQLKLIVESQKSKPELQLEILDQTANAFGKFLTWGFKQSVNAFKYLTGIGVNVYIGDKFTRTGKFPVKKQNPLAPLSLYNSELSALPKGYENLFKTIYNGAQAGQDIENQNTENNDVFQNIVNNLKFDSFDGITYPIKFQFQNLQRDAKENATLMMTTWGLKFNVASSGKATEQNNMIFNLVAFSSQGASMDRFLAMASKTEKNNDLLKMISRFGSANADNMSLIFSDAGQAQKFEKVMKKQIDDHMKVLIGHLNSDMGVKNTIKAPTITVKVANTLIGDVKLQPENQPARPVDEIDNDIKELNRQIQLYQNQENYKDYVTQLNTALNKLVLKKQEIINKK